MADTRIYSTGKRKTAVARVWLSPGSGKISVNERPADDYFVRETSRMVMRQSLELLEVLDQYDVQATVAGGGHSAQAERTYREDLAAQPGSGSALDGLARAQKAQGKGSDPRLLQAPLASAWAKPDAELRPQH